MKLNNQVKTTDVGRRVYTMYSFKKKYGITTNGIVVNLESGKELQKYSEGSRIYYLIDNVMYYADELLWNLFIGERMGQIKYRDGNEFHLDMYNLYVDLSIKVFNEKEIMINGIYFRQIPGFSRYYISANGTVYSKVKNTLVKRVINHADYLTVALVDDNGFRSPRKVHRMVYLTYIGELIDGQEIDHKNFNRHDCNYTNLQQISTYENQYRVQSIHFDNGVIPFDEIEKICILLDTGMSKEDVLESLNIHQNDISYQNYYKIISRLKDRNIYPSILKKFNTAKDLNDKISTGSRKLNKDDINEIKKLRAQGKSIYEIGEKFSVSGALISKILRGELWKDN